jgi:hypothetical protein
MFDTNAAKLRVVTDQICKLATLLHQVATGQAGNTILKFGYAQQLAQYQSRIIETQSLIEVRSQ